MKTLSIFITLFALKTLGLLDWNCVVSCETRGHDRDYCMQLCDP